MKTLIKLTDQDRANGFAEVRVAKTDGRLVVLKVHRLSPKQFAELSEQPPSPDRNFAFIEAATQGCDFKWVRR